MAGTMFDKFWHKTLKRPYILARAVDLDDSANVVLLHGIGRSGKVWEHVVADLSAKDVKVVAFDLLGFGGSPKPKWPTYNIDDHAEAVIASIGKLKPKGPVILVGHSMGGLVAVRVARLRPDLVKHLVLYEMPLYEGLPHKRSYRLRTDLYFRIYRSITRLQPAFNDEKARMVDRLANKIVGQEVTAETWQPFMRSLENTIMKQTAADDIKHLSMPMDVIYGRFDMFVIRGKAQHIFGVDNEQIATHTIRAKHSISRGSSLFVAKRILAAIEEKPAEVINDQG